MKMINIDNTNKKECCGCTACASICPKACINMTEDSEGFLYPVVDLSACVNCGLCEKVCPVKQEKPVDDNPVAYVVRHKDSDVVAQSTSGGAFTAITSAFLENGGTIYGGAFDKDYNVVHTSAKNAFEAKVFKGSKYVQSELGDTFSKIRKQLDNGEKVLFSGTPCQTAGLNSFLGKPRDNLITVDFVCHSIPSPKIWKMYLEAMKKKYNSEPRYINFRSKAFGYHSSSMQLDFENGKSYRHGLSTDMFMKAFFGDIICRPSCYDCHFKTVERYCDITVFDCWNISRFVPGLKDDDKGYTAVILHNKKAREFFDSAKKYLTVYDADIPTLIKYDGKFAVRSISDNPKRQKYFRLINEGKSIEETTREVIPIKTSKRILGATKGFLHKTGLMKLVQKVR